MAYSSRLQRQRDYVARPYWTFGPVSDGTMTAEAFDRDAVYDLTVECPLPPGRYLARIEPYGEVDTFLRFHRVKARVSWVIPLSEEQWQVFIAMPFKSRTAIGQHGATFDDLATVHPKTEKLPAAFDPTRRARREWWADHGDAARAYARAHHIPGPALAAVVEAVTPDSPWAIWARNQKAREVARQATLAKRVEVERILAELIELGVATIVTRPTFWGDGTITEYFRTIASG